MFLVAVRLPFPLPLLVVVFELLREGSWPKSSAVRSAGVADFVGSVLGAELTILLERDGDGLPCLVRDRAVLKLRVATRLAIVEGGTREVKATGASWLKIDHRKRNCVRCRRDADPTVDLNPLKHRQTPTQLAQSSTVESLHHSNTPAVLVPGTLKTDISVIPTAGFTALSKTSKSTVTPCSSPFANIY